MTTAKAKFTPGPWHIHEEYRDEIRGNADEMVCATYVNKNDEANANLIAAAPEMYEALKAMAADDAFAELCASIGEEPSWLKSARKALAKAEGEVPNG